MRTIPGKAAMALLPCLFGTAATAAPPQPTAPATAPATTRPAAVQGPQTVQVNLDPHIQPPIIVHLITPAGSDPQQARDALEARYGEILVDNQPLNRVTKPSDVVVYVAAPNAEYALYVLGRRLLTVNKAMAAASGAASPHALVVHWAHQLQQALPLLCWRPNDQPEPTVPPRPPLLITADLRKVGGSTGDVMVQGQKAFTLRGIQPDGRTAVDRASELTRRLAQLVAHGAAPTQAAPAPPAAPTAPPATPTSPPPATPTGPVQVQADATAGTATLSLGTSVITTVTRADAHANLAKSVTALAQTWAAGLNRALQPGAAGATG